MADLKAEHPQLAKIVEAYDFELPPVESVDTFTHASLFGVPREPFSASTAFSAQDYERKELWGDSILQFAVTMLLRHMYPLLTIGIFTELRARLVNNRTLAMVATHFNLQDKLRANVSQLQSLKDNVHVRSALFEAYLCTLYDEQGLDVVWSFVTRVFQPIARFYHDQLHWEKTAGAHHYQQQQQKQQQAASMSLLPQRGGAGGQEPALPVLGGPRLRASGQGESDPFDMPSDSSPIPEGNWIGMVKEWSDSYALRGAHYRYADGTCNETDKHGVPLHEQVLTIGVEPGVDYITVHGRATRKKAAQQRAAYKACLYLRLV